MEFWSPFLSPDNESGMLSNALIVLDTNALLNIYRYPVDVSKTFLQLLTPSDNRTPLDIWLPPHVIYEFLTNRRSVQNQALKDLNNLRDQIQELIDNKRIGIGLVRASDLFSDWAEKIGTPLSEFADRISSETQAMKARNERDEVLESLLPFFKTTSRYHPTDEEITWIKDNQDSRFKLKIPPGFKDKGKSTSEGGDDNPENLVVFDSGRFIRKSAGDLLIWHQTIEHVQTTQHEILAFVTDERKSDWFMDGQDPHPLLRAEAMAKGKDLRLISSSDFMKLASEFFGVEVTSEDLAAVESATRVIQFDDEGSIVRDNLLGDDELLLFITEDRAKNATDLLENHLRELGHRIDPECPKRFDFLVTEGDLAMPTQVRFLENPLAYHIFPIVQQAIEARASLGKNAPVCQLYLMSNSYPKLSQIRHGLNRTVERLGRFDGLRIVIALCDLTKETISPFN